MGVVKVALIVPGHSLPTLYTDALGACFDYVVAVNSAAYLYACDYMVATDRKFIDEICAKRRPTPRQAMVTYPAYRERLAKAGIGYREVPLATGKNGEKLKGFNFPRAILFSLMLAGLSGGIEIFGCDFSDDVYDAGGEKGEHYRERWLWEAQVLRSTWNNDQIVAVHGRIHPERLAFIRSERPDFPP